MAGTKPRTRTSPAATRAPSALTRLYLFLYNSASLAGWSYVLYRLLDHLAGGTGSFQSLLPSSKHGLDAIISRASTAYSEVGDVTRLVQTGAVLEIVHVLLGLVRSGLGTTVAQVASRLILVWGVLLVFPQTQTSPIFSSMVFAWSVAEMVRYSTYALAQFGIKLYPLEWLRYTLFYILYPLGAGSEAYLILSSIPWARQKYGRPGSIMMTLVLLTWPPALAGMMGHMHAQRKKYIGGGSVSAKKRA